MQFARSNEAKVVWRAWHLFREHARRTAYSAEEFSPQERTLYDLDTAGITGEDALLADGGLVEPRTWLDIDMGELNG